MALQEGDRCEVWAEFGPLWATGTIKKQGVYHFFISDEPSNPNRRTWSFRVDIFTERILWFDGQIDETMHLKKLTPKEAPL